MCVVPLALALGAVGCGKGPPAGGSAERDASADAGGTASTAGASATALATPSAAAESAAPFSVPVRLSMSPGGFCGIWADGSARCWGQSTQRTGARLKQPTPHPELLSIGSVRMTAPGLHDRCVLLQEGIIRNARPSLYDSPCLPEYVAGLHNVAQIVRGRSDLCARLENGEVICWAREPEGISPIKPTKVPGLRDVIDIAAGERHLCALRKNGTVWCWGQNISGELGDGTTDGTDIYHDRERPLPVLGLHNVRHIALGTAHSCAIAPSGDVLCWGDNGSDQLGTGVDLRDNPDPSSGALEDLTVRERPGKVVALSHAVELALGGYSCARTSDGKVYCWGSVNQRPHRSVPALVEGLEGVVQIVSAPLSALTCALLKTGETRCWGENDYGIFGTDSKMFTRTPRTVPW
jgi:alpha-tubulin suppressor-like RCC1 family protein